MPCTTSSRYFKVPYVDDRRRGRIDSSGRTKIYFTVEVESMPH